VAVHVRAKRLHRVQLDHGDTSPVSLDASREALPNPAVADDAEPFARGAQVRQPEDCRQRRLAGAVGVIEHVFTARVVGGNRRERQEPRFRQRPQASDAGRRFLRHALELPDELRSVLDDPPRQLGAVIDHDLRASVGDVEQVRGELVGCRAVMRMHLDAAPH